MLNVVNANLNSPCIVVPLLDFSQTSTLINLAANIFQFGSCLIYLAAAELIQMQGNFQAVRLDGYSTSRILWAARLAKYLASWIFPAGRQAGYLASRNFHSAAA